MERETLTSKIKKKMAGLKKGFMEKSKFFVRDAEMEVDFVKDGEVNPEEARLEAVVKEVENKPKSKKQKFSWVFLVVNVLIVGGIFTYQLINGGVKPISEFFNNVVYYRFLTLAFVMFVVTTVLETLKNFFLMYKCSKKKQFWLAYRSSSLGRYWDNITPLSSGGEPFMMYYLSKNGYSAGDAAGIPLAKSVFWQIGTVIMGIITLCTVQTADLGGTFIKVAAWIGIAGNTLVVLFVLLVSTNRKIGGKLIIGGLRLGYKMHIVKNYRKALRKTLNFVGRYQSCIKEFASSFWTVVSQLFLAILTSLAHFTIAYFVYLAFNYNSYLAGEITLIPWSRIVSLAMICDLAVSFIPLPGGSGAAEISFLAIFTSLVPEQTAFWALLFWRLFSYYSFIIQGFIITFVDFVRGKKSNAEVIEDKSMVDRT